MKIGLNASERFFTLGMGLEAYSLNVPVSGHRVKDRLSLSDSDSCLCNTAADAVS